MQHENVLAAIVVQRLLTCWFQTSPLLLRANAGLSPPVGSKVFGSASISLMVLSTESELATPFMVVSTGSALVTPNRPVAVLDFMTGENGYDAPTKPANKMAANFMVSDVVPTSRFLDKMWGDISRQQEQERRFVNSQRGEIKGEGHAEGCALMMADHAWATTHMGRIGQGLQLPKIAREHQGAIMS